MKDWNDAKAVKPVDLEYVLMYRKSGKQDVGWWDDQLKKWGPSHNRSAVTHWMYLPMAPRVSRKGK